jgi:hypothetical protein
MRTEMLVLVGLIRDLQTVGSIIVAGQEAKKESSAKNGAFCEPPVRDALMPTSQIALRFTLIALVVVLGGCNTEKKEAARVCKLLSNRASTLDELNSREADFLHVLRTWFAVEVSERSGPVLGGAGAAREIENQLTQLSGELELVWEELGDVDLKRPYGKIVHDDLLEPLRNRVNSLFSLKSILREYESAADTNFMVRYPFGQIPFSKFQQEIPGWIREHRAPSTSVAQVFETLRNKYSISDSDIEDSRFPTPSAGTLVRAIGLEHIPRVHELIERGAPVNEEGQDGMTPLGLACRHDNTIIAKWLLDKGARPNLALGGGAGEDAGLTPLALALSRGNLELIKMLLDRGADPNPRLRDGRTALEKLQGDPQKAAVVEVLKKAGAR